MGLESLHMGNHAVFELDIMNFYNTIPWWKCVRSWSLVFGILRLSICRITLSKILKKN